MCSGSKAGSYLRLIDFVYHSTLGLRAIKKKKNRGVRGPGNRNEASHLISSEIERDTTGYEPFALHAPIQWAI